MKGIIILILVLLLYPCDKVARVHIIRNNYNVMMQYDGKVTVKVGDTVQVTNYSDYNSYCKSSLWDYSSDIPHDTVTNCNGCTYNTIGRKSVVTELYK